MSLYDILIDEEYKPEIKKHKISSFREFVELIREELRCGHWLYRGLKQSKYKLIPTLARLENNGVDLFIYEMTMLRRTFGGSVDQDTGENSDINQLLMAQHHGAPTRLLDWTSSALVAAYFASEDVENDNDFKIVAAHVCPQSAVETHFSVHDLREVDFYNGYIDAAEARVLIDRERHSLKKELDKRGTIFVQGSDISPRVSAQQGYVSIQRDMSVPIDEQLSENIICSVHIEISADARQEFQETLYQLGIRRRSIFPDVDTLFGEHTREQAIHDQLCNQCSTGDQ